VGQGRGSERVVCLLGPTSATWHVAAAPLLTRSRRFTSASALSRSCAFSTAAASAAACAAMAHAAASIS